MNIRENDRFKSVSLYTGTIDISKIKCAGKSLHISRERSVRLSRCQNKDIVDKAFLVDKGHKDGMELHVVTKNGIIYVLNYMKFFQGSYNALITTLIARPNQVARLYEAKGLKAPQSILDKCFENQKKGLNV